MNQTIVEWDMGSASCQSGNALKSGYDLIGDIHGHAGELMALLSRLGYEKSNGYHAHPGGRKVIFLGDYIDRGPWIREVLQVVRGMVGGGSGHAILGNHEVNALQFHTVGSSGQPLRPHTDDKIRQHRATLHQFPDREEWQEWMQWLAGLPLFVERDGLRAVHACWDDAAIAALGGIGRLEGNTLEEFSIRGTRNQELLSRVVNGPEGMLPSGCRHETADGTMRKEFRVKWWRDLIGATCREAIFPDDNTIPDEPPRFVPQTGYSEQAPPTFFGHYALKTARPGVIRGNLACLDYGMGKGGRLCAYRWDGEQSLDSEKFVVVEQEGS